MPPLSNHDLIKADDLARLPNLLIFEKNYKLKTLQAPVFTRSVHIHPLGHRVVDEKQAVDKVAIRNVRMKDHVISGEVVSQSLNVIRNVELLFQYHWLWKNETRPGENPPGRAVYSTLYKELRPDGELLTICALTVPRGSSRGK